MRLKKILSVKLFVSFILFTSFLSAKPATQDKLLRDLSVYMENMKTAEGRFIQIAPDGSISEGEFALKRPGKIYFDYAPPTPLKIIADGFWIAVQDEKIKTMDRYPLSETPLKILLEAKPDFIKSPYNIRLENRDNSYVIHAKDPNSPEQGEVALVFSQKPISLRQWVVTDVQGLKTIVNLQDVRLNAPANNKLFYIDNDIKKGRR